MTAQTENPPSGVDVTDPAQAWAPYEPDDRCLGRQPEPLAGLVSGRQDVVSEPGDVDAVARPAATVAAAARSAAVTTAAATVAAAVRAAAFTTSS